MNIIKNPIPFDDKVSLKILGLVWNPSRFSELAGIFDPVGFFNSYNLIYQEPPSMIFTVKFEFILNSNCFYFPN